MNSIYNEIYGRYYFMLEKILEKAAKSSITSAEINSIVTEYGFSESSIYLTPQVLPGDESYNLLRECDRGHISNLKMCPKKFMTDMQKGFIKSMLRDKKIGLFLDEDMLKELEGALYGVEPLFDVEDIISTETALDSDNYSDIEYIKNFKSILNAIRNGNMLKAVFHTAKGSRKTVKIAPYKLEYGVRDDKFRLCGVSMFDDKKGSYIKVNLGRIISLAVLKESFDVDFEEYISSKRREEPIEIEVSDIRNGFERVFIGLSNYERISSYNEETGKSIIKIYYTEDDESELLILLLSFGPAVKVLGPLEFKNKFVERIRKQYEMIKEPQD